MKVLQAINLEAGYGSRKVLRAFNLEVGKGEKLAIMGPNGSGKTTFVKVLLKILKYSGSLRILGKELESMSIHEVGSKISFQLSGNVSSSMSVSTYLRLSGIEKLEEDPFSVSDLLGRQLNELSQGELQRVKLTRAFLKKSDILVLDEPFAHLDPYYQMKLVERIHEEERSVIFTIHDVMLALKFFRKHVLIKDGTVVCEGVDERTFRQVFSVELSRFIHPQRT